MTSRVIISGATGAIGTALINRFLCSGVEILVICRKKSSRIENIPNNPLIEVLFCDLEELDSISNESNKTYDTFYHFAWEGTSGGKRDDMYLQNQNIKYSLDAVGVAKRFGCKLFIGAGSQAEYGRVAGPLMPDTPTFPENGYGYAKLCAGLMTRDYAHQLGIQHVWVRVLSVYGPNDGQNTMISITINDLLNSRLPKFTRGEQIWDYLYSEDAAEAFYLLRERGIDGKVYVLGSGKARKIREYISIIKEEIKPDSILTFGEIPYSEKQIMNLRADISELQKDTGFIPKVGFRDGIRKTIESFNIEKGL